mmetsp:Transcript_124512/g.346636  ORF Transcript_124512/g.346636 Transcript_124512/m.346636 type:complete len:1078 (-) Transcript_124512:96-3329(-)
MSALRRTRFAEDSQGLDDTESIRITESSSTKRTYSDWRSSRRTQRRSMESTSLSSLSPWEQARATFGSVTAMAKRDLVISSAEREYRRSLRASNSSFDSSTGSRLEFEEHLSAEERLAYATRSAQTGSLVKYTEMVVNKDMRKVGVDKSNLIRVILDDEGQRKTCLAFPLILAYFALFAAIFQVHYGTAYINIQEAQMRRVLINQAMEVTSAADMYTWMGSTLLPYLWSCPNVAGDNLASLAFPTAGQELVAGLMISTSRGDRQKCSDDLVSRYDCFPEMPSVMSDDPVFNGWDQQQRRLSEVEGGSRGWAASLRTWVPRGVRTRLTSEGHRRQKARSSPGGAAASAQPWRREGGSRSLGSRSSGGGRTAPTRARRPSFHEHKRRRRLQEAEAQEAQRRLDIVKAHMKDSMPNLWAVSTIYNYVIPMSMTLEQVKDLFVMWALRDGGQLVTNSTLVVTLSFMLRNENLGSGLLTSVYVSFIFSRGGNVYTEAYFESLVLDTPIVVLVGFLFWAIIVLIFTVLASMRLFAAAKHGDCCSFLFRFTNFFEWVLLVMAWMILIMLLVERTGVTAFNRQWEEYQTYRATTPTITIQDFDRSWFGKIQSHVAVLGVLDSGAQTIVVFYHILLVFRFLLASKGHPRLAIVVNTISQGFQDLVHLFVVFAIIFASFVMAGHILFGHRMEPFASVKGSLGYCVQIVLQREYDGDTIAQENFETSTIWIWIFVILVVQVVVNIVLAMVFDNYGEVVMFITPQDTVWHTARRMWTQLRNLASWVSNHDLIITLNKLGREPISATRLKQLLPGIPEEQVDHLYETAKLRLTTSVLRAKKNILPEAIASILINVEELRRGVRMMGVPDGEAGAALARGSMTDDGLTGGTGKVLPRPPQRAAGPRAAAVPFAEEEPQAEETPTPAEEEGEAEEENPTLTEEGEAPGASPGDAAASPQPLATPREAPVAAAPRPAASDEEPPPEAPLWVEDGLLIHLRKRQATMDQLFLQLQHIQGEMRKRGLGANADRMPVDEPEQPSRDGSKRLDSTLTGQHMKPMITPGQERADVLVREPRLTKMPSGLSVVQRLGRA